MNGHQPVKWDPEAVAAVKVTAPAGVSLSAFMEMAPAAATVFAGGRIELLDLLSRRILANTALRLDPASVALAFWLRKANLIRMRDRALLRSGEDSMTVPAGRVFHIAPANVDTLFVYSWALSFLCGNRNVVRLSTRTEGVVTVLIGVIDDLMMSAPLLAETNAFVQYERSDEINGALSLWCDHRIVWGGDGTVDALRRVPMNPHASERAFASKYSWCVIKAAAWLAADDAQRDALAERFYNDVFWFDQKACSSPHAVFWTGPVEDCRCAAGGFDAMLAATVSRKAPVADASVAVQRRNRAFSFAVHPGVSFAPAQAGFTSVFLSDSAALDRETCGGGFIAHTAAASLSEVAGFVCAEDQTVTHFGFSTEELREFAAGAGARGLDRIVPVGQALDFSPEWDGYNLFQDFVRTVTVRS